MWLKEIRKGHGIRQKEIAEKLSVDWRTYESWERGERIINLVQARNYAVALDCSIDGIAGGPVRDSSEFSDSRETELYRCCRPALETGRTTFSTPPATSRT